MKFFIFIVSILVFDGIFLAIRERMLRLDKENAESEAQMAKNNLRIYRTINDGQVDALESQIDSLNCLYRSLTSQNAMLSQQNQELEQVIKRYQVAQKLMPQIPPATIEAVKYAMKKAHPDNGGNAEDFMKFKECYEELTKR